MQVLLLSPTNRSPRLAGIPVGISVEFLTSGPAPADAFVRIWECIQKKQVFRAQEEKQLSADIAGLSDDAAILFGKPKQAEPALPVDFVAELRQAESEKKIAKLILLGMEVAGVSWEGAALFQIVEALLSVGESYPTPSVEQVVVFTGHRIDSPTRPTPRFPSAMEPVARQAIRQSLRNIQKFTKGPIVGLAGGADGGDILFHEVCAELKIPTELLLTLPPAQFEQTSVRHDIDSWPQRYLQVCRAHPDAPVLAESRQLPEWLRVKKDYGIWCRNNFWVLGHALSKRAANRTLIALWDGEAGDGPGGTDHMVGVAKGIQAELIWLDTKKLFGLAARHAAPSNAV